MRLVTTICALLALVGLAAIFFLRNGLFMFALGYLLYSPPDDERSLASAFESLAAEWSSTPGMTLGVEADARLSCFAPGATPAVGVAFRRVNLVLLGAGAVSYSGLIPPEIRRLPGLRPDLVELGGPRPPSLAQEETESVDAAQSVLMAPDAPIFLGIALHGNGDRRALDALIDTLFDRDRVCV